MTVPPPACIAETAKNERFRLQLVTGVILLALGAIVVLLRLQGLAEIPPRLDADEAIHGLDALQVLQGEHAVFFDANHGREGLVVYAIALSISILGRTELAIRLPTALVSVGAVFVVFWLGRTLFGREGESGQATPWRGLFVGGVGAGLLAVSLGQTMIGRMAMRGNFLPFLMPLCMVLLWEGYRQRSWRRIALAGACAGLLPYTYIAARFTLLLLLFFGLSFLVTSDSVTRMRVRVDLLKRYLPLTGIFVGVAGLVAAPMLIHFALHPEDFLTRGGELSIFDSDLSQGIPVREFLVNTWKHLLLFGFHGDLAWDRNIPGRPMLNLWEALFLWLGTGIAFWRWRSAHRLLLIWLGALVLPAFLARDSTVPNTLRMIGAVPAIYLLTGVGIWEAFRFLSERFRNMQGGMVRLHKENKSRIVFAAAILVAGLIFVQGVTTYRIYFQKWAEHREVKNSYEAWLANWAWTLNALPSDAGTVYLIPGYSYAYQITHHYTFDYLYHGAASARTIYMSAPDLAQQIEFTLTAKEKVSSVRVVDWNSTNRWVRDDSRPVTFLLGKYGRYLGSDEHPDFQIHNYADISLERPWTFYEEIEPLTVLYDGGITLHGIALGQNEVQLPSRQPLNLGQERSLWGVLQWQAAPELTVDYAMSLRLYDRQGKLVHQADDIIWEPAEHVPSSKWPRDEKVDSLVQLEFPDELPPDEYELRLVVYNFETQVPTVEIGVWQPETTLARLRLGGAR